MTERPIAPSRAWCAKGCSSARVAAASGIAYRSATSLSSANTCGSICVSCIERSGLSVSRRVSTMRTTSSLSAVPSATSSSKRCLLGRRVATLALGRLPHRLVDHVPVVPLRLTLQVLERLPVLAVHVGAVRVLPVRLLALEDHAQPDLVRILCAAEGRVVDPARGRIILE